MFRAISSFFVEKRGLPWVSTPTLVVSTIPPCLDLYFARTPPPPPSRPHSLSFSLSLFLSLFLSCCLFLSCLFLHPPPPPARAGRSLSFGRARPLTISHQLAVLSPQTGHPWVHVQRISLSQATAQLCTQNTQNTQTAGSNAHTNTRKRTHSQMHAHAQTQTL